MTPFARSTCPRGFLVWSCSMRALKSSSLGEVPRADEELPEGLSGARRAGTRRAGRSGNRGSFSIAPREMLRVPVLRLVSHHCSRSPSCHRVEASREAHRERLRRLSPRERAARRKTLSGTRIGSPASYSGLRSCRRRSPARAATRDGRGGRIRGSPAWRGVLPPLRRLQSMQHVTMFSQTFRPPWDTGIT